jgi:ABC-type spermidine/putrescine transport system permease subunit II
MSANDLMSILLVASVILNVGAACASVFFAVQSALALRRMRAQWQKRERD